jgi:Ino eighty subunit 2
LRRTSNFCRHDPTHPSSITHIHLHHNPSPGGDNRDHHIAAALPISTLAFIITIIMSARPRRSAAQRATMAITDMADRDRDRDRERDTADQRTMSSRSSRRSGNGIASVTRGPAPSSPASSTGDGNQHIHLTVKLPSSKLRQATSSTSDGKRKLPGSVTAAVGGKGGVSAGVSKRTRGGKKSYVIESSEDEDEEEDEEDDDDEEEEQEEEQELDEIEVYPRPRFVDQEEEDDDEDEEMGDGDGDEMDVDAEGDDDDDEDADGDVDMDATPAPRAPAIKITKPPKGIATPTKGKSAPVARPVPKGTAVARAAPQHDDDDDDDDEELSELESEPEDVTLDVGHGDEDDAEGDDDEDVDAEGEGEEIEVAEEDAEGEEDEELLSDEDGDTPADLTKLTARQRAKLGDASHEYLKLSDGMFIPPTHLHNRF